MSRAERGMTLIEVMIASLIISLVMVAAIVSASHSQRSGLRLTQKTHAQWVANNIAAEIRAGLHGEITPTGSFQGQQSMGHQNWFWRAKAQSQNEQVIFWQITAHENENSPAIVTRSTGMWSKRED